MRTARISNYGAVRFFLLRAAKARINAEFQIE
jgi:hypothetical protein